MTTPPTAREIAELTARLWALAARGRETNAAKRATFLADKRALLDRIPSGATRPEPPPMSAEEAARRLTGPGRTLDESRAVDVPLRDPPPEQPLTESSIRAAAAVHCHDRPTPDQAATPHRT